jgi:hypothetical protein
VIFLQDSIVIHRSGSLPLTIVLMAAIDLPSLHDSVPHHLYYTAIFKSSENLDNNLAPKPLKIPPFNGCVEIGGVLISGS